MNKGVPFDEALRFLRSVTYKPGWRITVEPHFSFGSIRIVAETMVPDAVTPGRDILLQTVEVLDPQYIPSIPALQDRMRGVFRRLEMHEVDEWFKVDGVAPYYPH